MKPMLTVKHITLSGEETIYQTPVARYVPARDDGKTGFPNTLILERPDEPPLHLTGGTVFVTNDNGKTVARYDLGASPVPLSMAEIASRAHARDARENGHASWCAINRRGDGHACDCGSTATEAPTAAQNAAGMVG